MIKCMDDEDPYNIMMIMTITTTTRLELVGNPGGNKQRPCLGGFPTNGELCHPRRGLKYFQIERIFPSFPNIYPLLSGLSSVHPDSFDRKT